MFDAEASIQRERLPDVVGRLNLSRDEGLSQPQQAMWGWRFTVTNAVYDNTVTKHDANGDVNAAQRHAPDDRTTRSRMHHPIAPR